MNLLQLAPGGTFGRLIIWTEPAFKELQALFGSFKAGSEMKKGYHLMRPMMTNADLGRIINSDEVQSVVNPAKEAPKKAELKRNALKNRNVMAKLNPGVLQRQNNVPQDAVDQRELHVHRSLRSYIRILVP